MQVSNIQEIKQEGWDVYNWLKQEDPLGKLSSAIGNAGNPDGDPNFDPNDSSNQTQFS